jgi:hypothetical protein
MAKQNQTGTIITTPSPYGSHVSMILEKHPDYNKISENQVICSDPDRNFTYITDKWRIDNGLADANRYAN